MSRPGSAIGTDRTAAMPEECGEPSAERVSAVVLTSHEPKPGEDRERAHHGRAGSAERG